MQARDNENNRRSIEGRAISAMKAPEEYEASMKIFMRAAVAALLTVTIQVTGADAQQRVDAKKDWSVFETGEGASKQCWIVSRPTEWKATRGGQTVSVNRGDIFLMVAVRPADKVQNEVSFLGGYPFADGSKVEVKIGSSSYSLFTDKESAWAPSSKEDDTLVQAMRRGARAIVTGRSGRGNTTIDTFSLSGFTAALKSAKDRCK